MSEEKSTVQLVVDATLPLLLVLAVPVHLVVPPEFRIRTSSVVDPGQPYPWIETVSPLL